MTLNTLLAYTVTYVMVDVFCIIMGVVVERKVGDSFGSELEVLYFKRMIGFFLLFCLTDALWMPVNCGALPPNTLANGVLSTINVLSSTLVAFNWYCYAQVKMRVQDPDRHMRRLYNRLPLAVLVVLYALNPVTGWIYGFDQAGAFVAGPWYGLAALAGVLYIIVTACQALRRMRVSSSKDEMEELGTLVRFAVMPAFAVAVDAIVPNTPSIALGILAAVILVYSRLQDARVFNDALTGLNNRRRADRYVEERIADASPERPVYLYVTDVDLFKRINDTLGHIEGDRALRVVADGLRNAAAMSGGFAARWGGDEFVMIVDGTSVERPEAVVRAIAMEVQDAREAAGLGYELSVSTGYAVCSSANENPAALIARADEMLYEHKREAHEAVRI